MLDQATRREGERPRTKPKRRGWVMLLIGVAAAILIYRLPYLRMESLEVTGAQRLTRNEVMAAAGLEAGAFRLTHPADKVRAQLLTHPWIQDAQVTWQPRRLVITLTERRPVGLVRYHDLYYLLLDENGIILQQTELAGAGGLPVVSGVHVERAVLGRPLPHEGLLDALTVLSRMPDGLRSQVSEMLVGTDQSLTLYMVGGPTVLWGRVPADKDRIPLTLRKIENFSGFWPTVAKRASSACRIDLRVDGKAIPSGCDGR